MINHFARCVCLMLVLICIPQSVMAFCGVYVGGKGSKLYNDATQVVLMRQGTRTVLSMSNNYDGPAKGFAMVVPVPVVLQKENVKTLKHSLFEKINKQTSPRLVEYFEQDPCYVPRPVKYKRSGRRPKMLSRKKSKGKSAKSLGVTIESEFTVGEYNVLVLSAKQSNGLETWLRQEKYNIPKGAASVFKGYIQQGMYFFVAKVDVNKVRRIEVDGKSKMVLSPLRFHYDSKSFSLPVRLGLLNARGKQDLIVHVISREGRFEVANRKNVTVPTNLIVDKSVKGRFAKFYDALFAYTMKQNPGAVVTEYSWATSTCDPCPGPVLNYSDLSSLGADVIDRPVPVRDTADTPVDLFQQPVRKRFRRRRFRRPRGGWVVTRLHARYGAKGLKRDLTFKKAKPIIGGRGTPVGLRGKLDEQGSKKASFNNFQGRYIILNRWKGKIQCKNPRRGRWGGNNAYTPKHLQYVRRGKLKLKRVVKTKRAPGWRR